MVRKVVLGSTLFAVLALAVAVLTAAIRPSGDAGSGRNGAKPIPFVRARIPDAARQGLLRLAAKAGIPASTLAFAGADGSASIPGVVYGRLTEDAVSWAVVGAHVHTSFLAAHDVLGVGAPVYVGVATTGSAAADVRSDVVGVVDLSRISDVRVNESNGSVDSPEIVSWPNTKFGSFAVLTQAGVSPSEIVGRDAAGTVVFRRSIDVMASCFENGASCG